MFLNIFCRRTTTATTTTIVVAYGCGLIVSSLLLLRNAVVDARRRRRPHQHVVADCAHQQMMVLLRLCRCKWCRHHRCHFHLLDFANFFFFCRFLHLLFEMAQHDAMDSVRDQHENDQNWHQNAAGNPCALVVVDCLKFDEKDQRNFDEDQQQTNAGGKQPGHFHVEI